MKMPLAPSSSQENTVDLVAKYCRFVKDDDHKKETSNKGKPLNQLRLKGL